MDTKHLVQRMIATGLVKAPDKPTCSPNHNPKNYSTRFPQKIDDTITLEIRRRRACGETTLALAKAFNITPSYVSQIARGKRRKRSLKQSQ